MQTPDILCQEPCTFRHLCAVRLGTIPLLDAESSLSRYTYMLQGLGGKTSILPLLARRMLPSTLSEPRKHEDPQSGLLHCKAKIHKACVRGFQLIGDLSRGRLCFREACTNEIHAGPCITTTSSKDHLTVPQYGYGPRSPTQGHAM